MINETTTTESVPISVLRKRKLDGHNDEKITNDQDTDDDDDTIDFSKRIMRIEKPKWLKKNPNNNDNGGKKNKNDDDLAMTMATFPHIEI